MGGFIKIKKFPHLKSLALQKRSYTSRSINTLNEITDVNIKKFLLIYIKLSTQTFISKRYFM